MAARHGVPRSSARGDGSRSGGARASRSRDHARPRTRDVRTARNRPVLDDGAEDLDAPDFSNERVTETGEHDDLDVLAAPDPLRRSSGRDVSRRLSRRWAHLDTKRAVGLALVLSIVALTLAMPLRTYFSQRSEFEQLRTSNQQLAQQVDDYQQKVNEQNDPAYIEAKARERLQFVKPGETPLVMMYPDDDARKAAARKAEERAGNPWYGNLWDSIANPPDVG